MDDDNIIGNGILEASIEKNSIGARDGLTIVVATLLTEMYQLLKAILISE